MALVTGPCFLDTSVLLAGIIDTGAPSEQAQRVMEAVVDVRLAQPTTAWHCCLEFYAVATRLPLGLRVAPSVALRLVEDELLARLAVHDLPDEARLAFLRTAVHDRAAGGRIYDAHIAEIARLAGVEVVLTENRRHFTSLLRHGVRVLTAAEVVAELPAG